jgi:hypothetical protein
VRRRRATARRSLLDVFDAALTLSDASQASQESDSELHIQLWWRAAAAGCVWSVRLRCCLCAAALLPSGGTRCHSPKPKPPPPLPRPTGDCDMLGSQDSARSCSTQAAAGASPDAASPRCLFPPAGAGGAGSSGAPSPVSLDDEPGSPAAACQPGGAAGPGDHLLPLQHLLMSEQAQHLTALEVKAVVAKASMRARLRPPCSRSGCRPFGWLRVPLYRLARRRSTPPQRQRCTPAARTRTPEICRLISRAPALRHAQLSIARPALAPACTDKCLVFCLA